ncbi:hypothetical protein [Microbacterium sp. 1.5R]|uniref:hypothetical protein n=1 Tax=Microbacterium sp. 1.5R TaxID=1916917 RepID=UPI0011A3062B|nr:hypothetical protein [Microbacterium sp. 1.5R]
MLHADEIEELRALQARAYGRGGGLSASEARRLGELEGGRGAAGAGAESRRDGFSGDASDRAELGESDGAGTPRSVTPADGRAVRGEGSDSPSPVAAAMTVGAASAEPLLAVRSRRLLAALVCALVLMGLGVLIGWIASADRGPDALDLTAEQQQWQSELLATGDYDPGSLRALREEEGVVIWFATREDGDDVCLVLADGERSIPSCTTAELVRAQGLYGSLATGEEGDLRNMVDAQMYLDDEGDPAIITYSYVTSSSSAGMRFASEAEAEAAKKLGEAEWDERTIVVAGYDGDTPLWFATEKSTQRVCLIYDGSQPDPLSVCEDRPGASPEVLRLALTRAEDGTTTTYDYAVSFTQQYLTITRNAGDADG